SETVSDNDRNHAAADSPVHGLVHVGRGQLVEELLMLLLAAHQRFVTADRRAIGSVAGERIDDWHVARRLRLDGRCRRARAEQRESKWQKAHDRSPLRSASIADRERSVQTVKLSPQPQAPLALGLSNM